MTTFDFVCDNLGFVAAVAFFLGAGITTLAVLIRDAYADDEWEPIQVDRGEIVEVP
ncbi:hypothetical protein BJD58_gp42 [Gordonia phage UmaThurman]|uniref:hypothetical protein n=1 Tax=Gordonia phage UmaThurman TaxID=1821563 RepID=UPI00078BFC34|nr:hypothetical protein BJD58_gp42 [Gordonia phage UmaThurman]AMS03942.1 hypothetical protein SEA_UMATHURMAN_42 [Gordonia phage UmaThurman]QFG09669.1 hypothetical protein PBI_PIPP_45 [Gordonia phage Pipp]